MSHLEDAKAIVAGAMHIDPSGLNEETSAETAAGWDSVAHINILLAIEERIGGGVPVERIVALSSVGAIAAFLQDFEGGGPSGG
ncbi:MAG: acyl carrier protein [Pseudomonadota bacterium]